MKSGQLTKNKYLLFVPAIMGPAFIVAKGARDCNIQFDNPGINWMMSQKSGPKGG